MSKESLIEWAASWVPETMPDDPEYRRRFAVALAAELKNWTPPPPGPEACKHCPFYKHVHYEQEGKLLAPGCTGFEAME